MLELQLFWNAKRAARYRYRLAENAISYSAHCELVDEADWFKEQASNLMEFKDSEWLPASVAESLNYAPAWWGRNSPFYMEN